MDIFTIFCSFLALCLLAQFAAIAAGSFQKLWGINTSLTLEHFKKISRFTLELKNSLLFAFISAVLSSLLATLAAFFVLRSSLPLKKYLNTCVQLPAAIPGSLFGLAFSLTASRLHIHASGLLIIIAMTVAFLPFSYRIISTVFSQIKNNLDDACSSLGANKMQVLTTMLVPVSKSGIFSSFIYDFVRGVGTISSVIFLVSF